MEFVWFYIFAIEFQMSEVLFDRVQIDSVPFFNERFSNQPAIFRPLDAFVPRWLFVVYEMKYLFYFFVGIFVFLVFYAINQTLIESISISNNMIWQTYVERCSF